MRLVKIVNPMAEPIYKRFTSNSFVLNNLLLK